MRCCSLTRILDLVDECEEGRSGTSTRQRKHTRVGAGFVCLVITITIQGVPALVTPHFAHFGIPGEGSRLSSYLTSSVIGNLSTFFFRDKINPYNISVTLILPKIFNVRLCESIQIMVSDKDTVSCTRLNVLYLSSARHWIFLSD